MNRETKFRNTVKRIGGWPDMAAFNGGMAQEKMLANQFGGNQKGI
jgi:hypothetical protein